MRFFAAAGVFALGLAGLYVARIGPDSTYTSGLLPALFARGIGIPLFSTCATLALLSAVPLGKAGLASGTLGMARNVGTAFGIAALGVVFNARLDSTLPARLADLPAAQAATIRAAAANFTIGGAGAARAAAADAILHGFAALALVTALFCLISTLALLAIRPRAAPEPGPRPATGGVREATAPAAD